jgi:hypothetical protein
MHKCAVLSEKEKQRGSVPEFSELVFLQNNSKAIEEFLSSGQDMREYIPDVLKTCL